jgi:hypothetical protein
MMLSGNFHFENYLICFSVGYWILLLFLQVFNIFGNICDKGGNSKSFYLWLVVWAMRRLWTKMIKEAIAINKPQNQ